MGAILSLLIVAPAFNYDIPVTVNSFAWCYVVVACGMLGFFLWKTGIPIELKVLASFLFASCFISQSPYLSFNAYILVILTIYLYLALRESDFDIIVNFIEAAFWLQVFIVLMQLLGKDTLLSFGSDRKVFLGTVMQYMRVSTVFAIMAPFLIMRSKFYFIPLAVLCFLSRSMTFAVSLTALGFFHIWFNNKNLRLHVLIGSFLILSLYAAYDWGSIRGAILPENGGRLVSWYAIIVTWIIDTSKAVALPVNFGSGNFRIDWFLFGHGMDTFLPLFPIYKHDMNPFPQAHNCWLQILWEIGALGFSLIAFHVAKIVHGLKRLHYGIALFLPGIISISLVMFFSFPTRMTQTALLIVAYLALCEQTINREYKHETFL